MLQKTSWKQQPWLQMSDEVATALEENSPIVALESTVIAHGLPYPYNVQAALRIEQAVREGGAIPATICINRGKFIIGMTESEIEQFASQRGIPKVSSRDVSMILAQKGLGATTVASTLIAADLANIPFFSTAGIGGVHRGASITFDISADLIQFTRSRVAVVCAGAKSILDIGLTLEYLETFGIPIVGYRSQDFPAFYSVSSGYRCPHSCNDASEIAQVLYAHWSIGNDSAMLITHPIDSSDAIDNAEIEQVIQNALRQAEHDHISGPAITPYLMKKVSQATEGRSAKANMAVLVSTAKTSAELASVYAHLVRTMK